MNFLSDLLLGCFYLRSGEMKRWKFRVLCRAWTTLEHHIKAQVHLSKNSMQISLCSLIYLTERLQLYYRKALSVWVSYSIVLDVPDVQDAVSFEKCN